MATEGDKRMTTDDRAARERPDMATADELQAVVETGEAGLQDLLAAYDLIEEHYFSAAPASSPPSVTYATDTRAACVRFLSPGG